MGETWNHIDVAMFPEDAAVRTCLTNPSYTSSENAWLPFRKNNEPTKIKHLNFDREDFAQPVKRKDPL